MTEQWWTACREPKELLEFLRGKTNYRKFRLFACAVCRAIWDALPDQRSRTAVEIVERFADGRATSQKLSEANDEAREAWVSAGGLGKHAAAWFAAWDYSGPVADAVEAATLASSAAAGNDECSRGRFAALIRDIFGNPFHPVALDPRWLSASVLDLTRAIYDGRAFERMPVLADALMDASCDNEDIINHCRGDGPHVRGCWVVDLILGKQ